jgi:hypothetical protein
MATAAIARTLRESDFAKDVECDRQENGIGLHCDARAPRA